MKIIPIKTDKDLEEMLNNILKRIFELEKSVSLLDTEIALINEDIYTNKELDS